MDSVFQKAAHILSILLPFGDYLIFASLTFMVALTDIQISIPKDDSNRKELQVQEKDTFDYSQRA